jgi:hypothetical protein
MKLLSPILAGSILAISPALALQAQTTPSSRPASSYAHERPLVGPQTLRDLLGARFQIVETDAPAGALKVRVILNRRDKLYSCEPELFRSGADGEVHVLDTPCIDLTP